MTDHKFITLARSEARTSAEQGGIGVGAVLAKGELVVAKSSDQTRQLNDPIAVAEVNCIREAGRRNDQSELTLYTTRVPDMLGAGTIVQFSIGSVVIGEEEENNPVIKFLRDKNIPLTFTA